MTYARRGTREQDRQRADRGCERPRDHAGVPALSLSIFESHSIDSFLILLSLQSPYSAIEISKMTSKAFELLCFGVEIV